MIQNEYINGTKYNKQTNENMTPQLLHCRRLRYVFGEGADSIPMKKL